MRVICVDDESWALEDLLYGLKNDALVTSVMGFSNADDAIASCMETPFDAAFIDIDLRGTNGLELAKKLREINEKCFIVFCTGYNEYMANAFKLHATGYLLKPILPDDIHTELEYMSKFNSMNIQVYARCYGGFDVYDKDMRPIIFKRTRAKELLALLIDRNGISMTSKEICTYLWSDGSDMDKKNLMNLYKLFGELNRALTDVGAQDVVIKSGTAYSADMTKIALLDNDAAKLNERYMPSYSWAEYGYSGS